MIRSASLFLTAGARPNRALRLLTIHEAEAREYAAVAMVGLREGWMRHYKAHRRSRETLFYMSVTRAERLLMYIYQHDRSGTRREGF